jgi:cytidylate kinase
MIVAIDGPAGTGKSSVAKEVARSLRFAFFDTGALYRSLAWWVEAQGITWQDESGVKEALCSFHWELRGEDSPSYFVNGTDVTLLIRKAPMADLASKIAAYGFVRDYLLSSQRHFAEGRNVVFEGRDIGTVVFPQADVKIFLTASPRVRAERRQQDLSRQFPHQIFSVEEILSQIEQRDGLDERRAACPLKRAPDAVEIDTTFLTFDEVVKTVLAKIRPHLVPSSSSKGWFYGTVYWTVRGFFRLFYGLKIEGDMYVHKGAGLIVANHASYLDPPVLSVSCPEEVHFLARGSLFQNALFGWFIRKLNAHPVEKTGQDVKVFRDILKLLSMGHKVILFPEGVRSLDGCLQPFQRGLAFIVMKAKVPIYPAYLQGTYQVWPRGQRWPKWKGKVTCRFGPPLYFDVWRARDKRALEEEILSKTWQAVRNLEQG